MGVQMEEGRRSCHGGRGSCIEGRLVVPIYWIFGEAAGMVGRGRNVKDTEGHRERRGYAYRQLDELSFFGKYSEVEEEPGKGLLVFVRVLCEFAFCVSCLFIMGLLWALSVCHVALRLYLVAFNPFYSSILTQVQAIDRYTAITGPLA